MIGQTQTLDEETDLPEVQRSKGIAVPRGPRRVRVEDDTRGVQAEIGECRVLGPNRSPRGPPPPSPVKHRVPVILYR